MLLKQLIKYQFSNIRPMRVKYILQSNHTMFNLNHFRTALAAYYYARSNEATFILHLDDIKEQPDHQDFRDVYTGILKQCINWDEGYQNQYSEDGQLGPYESSQKQDKYKEIVEQLIKEGKAYRCFCDKESHIHQNNLVYKNNKIPQYSGVCRNLTEEQIQKKLNEKVEYCIRLKTDELTKDPYKKIYYRDEIQPNPFIYQAFLYDMIIIKSNGQPSKFFSYSIDDIDQKITHVVRGQEWMKDIPKQQVVYKLLNHQDEPKFFHLPNMLDSNHRYFKNEELFRFFQVKDLIKQGISIQALANFVITQIWRNQVVSQKIRQLKEEGKTQDEIYACELFSPEYLMSSFTMQDIKQESFEYDQLKLNYFNRHFIRQKYLPLFSDDINQKQSDRLINEFREILIKQLGPDFLEAINRVKDKNIVQIIEIVTNRIRKYEDLNSYPFFFIDPIYNTQREKPSRELIFKDPSINKKYVQVIKDMINIYNKKIADSQFDESNINKQISYYIKNVNTKLDKDIYYKFLRFTFTGYHQSHAVGLVSQIIGKTACLRRLRNMQKLLEDVPQGE
ncbi:hypothetical protein ABPG72_010819 [Tetrahymena utriculariae]